MANYATLKAAIQQVVKTNGNNEITGALLQQSLLAMINSLGANYQFAGIATPSTNPGTPDQNVFYIASAPGTYSNFGSVVLGDGDVCILAYNGSWSKMQTSLANLYAVVLARQMALSYSKNWFNKNDADCKTNYYLGSNGQLIASAGYCVSGFIPLTEEIGHLVSSRNGTQQTVGGAYICVYDSQKNVVASGTIGDLQGVASWQQGVAFARFSFLATNLDICQVEVGTVATDLMQFGIISPDKLPLDNTLSIFSNNPVKNKAIANAIDGKVGFSSTNKSGNIVWSGGYVREDGITQSFGFFHGEFDAKIGDRIVVTMPYDIVAATPAILKKNPNNTYTAILTFSSAYNGYTYIVTEDATLCLNFRNGTSTFDGTGVSVNSPSVYDVFNTMGANFVSVNTGKNLANPSEFLSGYYLGSTGELYQNSDYAMTGYIPFTQEMGKLILSINGGVRYTGSSYHCVYNANKVFIRSYKVSDLAGAPIVWQSGDAFIRFSMSVPDGIQNYNVQVEPGEFPTAFVPYGKYIDADLLEPATDTPNLFNSFRDSGALANGESLTLPLTYVRNNLVLSAMVAGTLEIIELGQGDGVYNGGHITITNQNIIIGSETTPHGLTLTGRTAIIMSRGQDGKVTIIASDGGKFDIAFSSTMGGAPYIKNNGVSSINVELSFMPKNITKKIWLIGDSYLSVASTRWPYWVKNMGFENYMIDNLPGGGSLTMIEAFTNDLTIGCPKYAFWGLGMNDGTDTNVTDFNAWKGRAIKFITLCLTYGITPIMATIPSVPNISNENRNTWIRNCGYRYIDFAKAVNAQPNGTWDPGLIATDNVHPSEAGAKVLAGRVLIDFPEIAYE